MSLIKAIRWRIIHSRIWRFAGTELLKIFDRNNSSLFYAYHCVKLGFHRVVARGIVTDPVNSFARNATFFSPRSSSYSRTIYLRVNAVTGKFTRKLWQRVWHACKADAAAQAAGNRFARGCTLTITSRRRVKTTLTSSIPSATERLYLALNRGW